MTAKLLGWIVFGYVALIAIRYVLGARMYLTCALREASAVAADPQRLTPTQLRVLSAFDTELAAAGFRHLGYSNVLPLITHYELPNAMSVFVNDSLPAYAFVQRRLAPEYGAICELGIGTEFSDGRAIETINSRSFGTGLTRARVEERPDLAPAELLARHAARVEAERSDSTAVREATLESAIASVTKSLIHVREQFRSRGWVVPTSDSRLDRFTLRGAFALTHRSIRMLTPPRGQVVQPPTDVQEQERLLRIEADLDAVKRKADMPERAPGTPWPLITLIGATALLSFVAMAVMWNTLVAAVILAVVILHEAGHALAMRLIGYRDVHVFFVPLLGAMTVGRTTISNVRGRLAMLLAGPVPGLWLAVLLLVLEQTFGPMRLFRASALALLLINGLNLLPVTPFDGGRALELLSRPESVWRLITHVISIAGLIALALVLKDPVVTVLAIAWALLFRRQLLAYRLRRAVAQGLRDRSDFSAVVRSALEAMSAPRYATWRSPTRQLTAHGLAKLFAEPVATSADRAWGVAAYAAAWVPVLIGLLLWKH